MQRKALLSFVVAATVLLLGTAVFAAEINLTTPVMVNGTQLAPGTYKVNYTGSGPDVQVSFLQGKRTVATAPAHLEDRANKAPYDAAIRQANGSGPETLTQILLNGKKQVLVFNGSSASMGSGK